MEDEILVEQELVQGALLNQSQRLLDSPSSTLIADENTALLAGRGKPSSVNAQPGNHPGNEPEQEWEGIHWSRKPSVFLLLIPFSLFAMAWGGIAVPRLNIIIALICRDYFVDQNMTGWNSVGFAIEDDDRQCQIPEVQALVSRFTLYMSLVSGILGAIASPRLGAYSDRHGRRIILAVSSLGLLSSEMTTILAAKYPDDFSVNLLLVGSVIDGITGSFMAGMAVASAYAADCTSAAKRAVSFGYFQGMLFLGTAVGPALGGILVKRTGNILSVFYASLAAHLIFLLYLAFVLPESLTAPRMLQAQEKYRVQQLAARAEGPKGLFQRIISWNPFQPLNVLFPRGPGTTSRLSTNLVVLAAIDTIIFGVAMGAMTVIIIYAEFAFGWGNYESSIYLSFVNFTRVLWLFLILPTIMQMIRAYSERRQDREVPQPHDHDSPTPQSKLHGTDTLEIGLIRFAIATEALGYLGYALAPNGSQFTLAGMLIGLGSVGSPTIQSAMTKHIPREKTGQLLGATALLHSLARVISPTIFNLIYAETVGTFPQAVFICLASGFLLAAACTMFITPYLTAAEYENETEVDGVQGD